MDDLAAMLNFPRHIGTAVIENIVHPQGHPVRSYLVLKFRRLCIVHSILPERPRLDPRMH